MLDFGRKYCNRDQIQSLSTWEGSVWYYDGIRVYYQIYQYTGDPFWRTCAGFVKEVYLPYVLDNQGNVGAWRVFPDGLYEDFLITGDDRSRQAIMLLANSSPFASQGGGPAPELSRETAYLIEAYLVAAKIQSPAHPNLARAVDYALGHLDQWFQSESAHYVTPFMAGLTMEALIDYHQEHPDPRIPVAIRAAVDWLWKNAWDPSSQSFRYVICRSQGCPESEGDSVELNLLIAPAYAWLYRETGEQKYRDQGDAVFSGGISRASLSSGKQFSQNYRWSFDFVRWRR